MHGIIFTALRRYVDAKLGPAAWDELVASAGVGGQLYLPVREYPDQELVALVSAASKRTGANAETLLEDFGAFAAPGLIDTYKSLLKPGWRTLDVIEHTEGTIHTTVRRRNPGAAPPKLQITRVSPTEAVITYSSPRKMCAVGKGLVKGIAKYYGDPVTVTESSCMARGGSCCKITVKSR